MNICIISGSARENNNTIRVAYALEKLIAAGGHQYQLIDFKEYDIPFINQGNIAINHLSAFQQKLTSSMLEADLVILISPEYNWSTTPEILNFLHRFGDKQFASIFSNKTFSMVGVSTGKGGKTPALHLTSILNKIISFMNLDSIVSPKIFEAHYTKEALNEHGESMGNVIFDNGLSDFLNYTLRIANRWKKHTS